MSSRRAFGLFLVFVGLVWLAVVISTSPYAPLWWYAPPVAALSGGIYWLWRDEKESPN